MVKSQSPLPSVDDVLNSAPGLAAVARHGHAAARDSVRATLAELRRSLNAPGFAPVSAAAAAALSAKALDAAELRGQRRVFNLSGTILHTNLGRAILAESAAAAAMEAMRHPVALEFDLDGGGRGGRDDAVRALICELTGAESACLVNNNAAAVLLMLNTLSKDRETIVSRGELIEIGGAFRMPEIMAGAGARLKEVGATNRTHLSDYQRAIGPDTGLILKVHTSNYLIQGFTSEVSARELAPLARETSVVLADDLGSGTLADLTQFGLKRERTVQEALGDGVDLVTFSGDKLLGGPQAGIIAGRADLVRACAINPLKRALRLDKIRLAALEATLQLYRHPETLSRRLPTLGFFTRALAELEQLAFALQPALAAVLGPAGQVEIVPCGSQIGSGALPLETIPSVGLSLSSSGSIDALSLAFRRLPVPVIGHIARDRLIFDLRCLDDEKVFVEQLSQLGGASR